jgi:hypothetical protein
MSSFLPNGGLVSTWGAGEHHRSPCIVANETGRVVSGSRRTVVLMDASQLDSAGG